MIRGLTIATGVLALAYGGWWFVAAQAARGLADNLMAGLAEDGLAVDYDLTVRGFPSRIDTTFGDLSISDPASGLGWAAPWFQVFALSYSPNRIIAAWPPEQVVTLGDMALTLGSDSLMASARVALATDLALENVTLEGRALTVTGAEGWQGGAAHLLAALRRVEGATYDIFAEATEIALPDQVMAVLDPAGALPGRIPVLRLDAQAVLDAPIARDTTPVLRLLHLRDLRADWGDTGLSLTGRLVPDGDGLALGVLDLSLRNWPRLVELAVGAGLIAPDQAGLWEGALRAAARGDLSLTAPITVENGTMSIGLFPLGPAPRIGPPRVYSQ